MSMGATPTFDFFFFFFFFFSRREPHTKQKKKKVRLLTCIKPPLEYIHHAVTRLGKDRQLVATPTHVPRGR